MKKILLALLCSTGFAVVAQDRNAWGVSAGINEYYAQPTFISAKSGTGYAIGVIKGVKVTKNSDVVVDASFIRFNMKYSGYHMRDETPRWLDFHSNRIGLGVYYYYDLLNLKKKVTIGLQAGANATYINNFSVKGRDNASYVLDPYDLNALILKISRYYDGSFNTFAVGGLNASYKNVELNLRYHFALTSPYRALSNQYGPIEVGGKDDYLSITFNFYVK